MCKGIELWESLAVLKVLNFHMGRIEAVYGVEEAGEKAEDLKVGANSSKVLFIYWD